VDITTFFVSAIFVNAIGFVATAFSICMWIPQARITWQNRNDPIRLAGVSETTQWLSMCGYLLWGVFGVMIESFWVAAPSLVSFPLSVATIIVVRRGRRLPATRTVPILSTTGPMDVIPATFVPSTFVPSTGPVPILSTPSSTPEAVETGGYTPTTPIPVLA
jgi:uncharacterized protein with PQ loop repeat